MRLDPSTVRYEKYPTYEARYPRYKVYVNDEYVGDIYGLDANRPGSRRRRMEWKPVVNANRVSDWWSTRAGAVQSLLWTLEREAIQLDRS